MKLFMEEVSVAQTARWLCGLRLHRPLSFFVATGSALGLALVLDCLFCLVRSDSATTSTDLGRSFKPVKNQHHAYSNSIKSELMVTDTQCPDFKCDATATVLKVEPVVVLDSSQN